MNVGTTFTLLLSECLESSNDLTPAMKRISVSVLISRKRSNIKVQKLNDFYSALFTVTCSFALSTFTCIHVYKKLLFYYFFKFILLLFYFLFYPPSPQKMMFPDNDTPGVLSMLNSQSLVDKFVEESEKSTIPKEDILRHIVYIEGAGEDEDDEGEGQAMEVDKKDAEVMQNWPSAMPKV